MTSRERVLAVWEWKIPDRVPMWCGASPEFMAKARRELHLATDEDVLERFHDDFRRVYSRYAGPARYDAAANGDRMNIFGVTRHGEGYGMPANAPLAGATLAEIEAYPWPTADWIDVSHTREDALAYGGEFAILGGEWCPFFHDLLDLLGYENAMIQMYEEPEIVHAVLDHVVDYYFACNERIFEAAADVIDIAFMGNDMGSQNGPLLGVNLFDEFFAPRFQKLCDLAHRYGLHTQLHCCGGFDPLIPSMHKAGIEAVQSLQPVNAGMDPRHLKNTYGDQMIFNGGVDSVNRLIYGTRDSCIEATREVLSIMKPGGGFVLSPSHDYLLEMTPVENVVAMYDTGLDLGGY